MKNSGIPLFAACTGNEFCKMRMEQHELVSGFFAAILSFSKESFRNDHLQSLVFSNLTIDFLEDEEYGIVIAFLRNKTANEQIIQNHLKRTHDEFLLLYGEYLKENKLIDTQQFSNFKDQLKSVGVIGDNLVDIQNLQILSDEEVQSKKRPNLIQWMKNKMSKITWRSTE